MRSSPPSGAWLVAAPAELGVALQQLLRQRQQLAPARIQMQASALAIEYRRTQLLLHFRQRHARRRLGQVQLLGGRAHAAEQGDLHEDLELARADVDHQHKLIACIRYFKFS